MQTYTCYLGKTEAQVHTCEPGEFLPDAFEIMFPRGELYGLDVETTYMTDAAQWDPDFLVRTVQVGTEGYAWVLRMDDPAQVEAARELLSDPGTWFCSHTPMDVLSVWVALGVDISARNIDTRGLAAMAAGDDRLGGRDLKTLATTHLGPQLEEGETELHEHFRDLLEAAGGKRSAAGAVVLAYGWGHVDASEPLFVRYAGLDAVAARRLAPILTRATGAPRDLLRQETGLAGAVNRITMRGARVDVTACRALHAEADGIVGTAERVVREITGVTPRSPKIADYLRDHGADFSDYPVTPTGRPSMAASDVKGLLKVGLSGDAKTVVEHIVRLKASQDGLQKTTKILASLDSQGKVHPEVNPLGAVTGRMTSSGINFLNFSKDDARMRGLFLPDEGHSLITCDFDQIELRVVAALARETKMIDVIKSGGDLHQLTADEIGGIDRDLAKMTNFLIVYGGGAKALSEQSGLPEDRCRDIVRAHRDRYPAITEYSRRLSRYTTSLRTITNRRVPVTKDKAGNPRVYANINYMVQSSARDLLIHAWLRYDRMGHGRTVWMPIHDELVCMVPEGREEELMSAIEDAMTFDFLGVPVSASAIELRDPQGVSRWMSGKVAEKYAAERKS